MPTNNNRSQALTGEDAFFASLPMAQTPQGGVETGFSGESDGVGSVHPAGAPGDVVDQYAGMGPLLEEDDKLVFQTLNNLVLRQDLIARNHLAQDSHWTCVKRGYPWSLLEYNQNQSVYTWTMPYGTGATSVQAVPNKNWDLINKAAETLLVDFPSYDPKPENDSEEAEQAATMAGRFLNLDSSEDGTNDAAVFYQALDKALTCASSYVHVYTDPTGDGSVPLQIMAHPLAESTENPLVGPDGMPTTDYILRYVTKDGQFTNDPSQAAPQWMPKLRTEVWGREHIRVFPETATVSTAEKVIGLYYCTIGEAKRRWKAVSEMSPDQLSALCGWTPPRYLVLLPPFERARWKLTTSNEKERSGASDERVMFYYIVYQRSVPEYPKGAQLVVTGADGGRILDKSFLAATVERMGDDGTGPKTEVRPLDIPVVQVTPRIDADDRDPSGTAYIELFGGATEFNASLQMSYLEAMDIILHTEKYTPSTSPVEGWQVREARASGDSIPLAKPEDKPVYGQTPPLPPNLLDMLQYGVNQQDSIASLNKPIQGDNTQQEVSGKARQIAVQQAMIGLNRMQKAVNSSIERFGRVKVQLCMRDFTVPQQVRYVGEDGAYKQEEWTGTDFALVGDVRIKDGTGTMMTPEAKVNYLGSLTQYNLIDPIEARSAARPAFASDLGITQNPHEQYVERCVTAWLKGPPEGWVQAAEQYQQALQQYQTAIAPVQQQYQALAQQLQATGQPVPPPPQLPPAPPAPWSPFQPRINDSEPEIAVLWKVRLSKVISSVKYDTMWKRAPAWCQILDQKYQTAVQVLAPPAAPAPAGPPSGAPPSHSAPEALRHAA